MSNEGQWEILICVSITEGKDGQCTWSFESDEPGVDPETGNIRLLNSYSTMIVFTLAAESAKNFDLVFANLSPHFCITRQITAIKYGENTITIYDQNSAGLTSNQAFGFNLVARRRGDLSTPIISPDPQVTNDPNTGLE